MYSRWSRPGQREERSYLFHIGQPRSRAFACKPSQLQVQIDVAVLSTRPKTTYILKHDAETYSDTPHRMLQLLANSVAKLTASIGGTGRRQCRTNEAHSLQASADLPNLRFSLWSEVRRQSPRDTLFAILSNSTIALRIVPATYALTSTFTERNTSLTSWASLHKEHGTLELSQQVSVSQRVSLHFSSSVKCQRSGTIS